MAAESTDVASRAEDSFLLVARRQTLAQVLALILAPCLNASEAVLEGFC